MFLQSKNNLMKRVNVQSANACKEQRSAFYKKKYFTFFQYIFFTMSQN